MAISKKSHRCPLIPGLHRFLLLLYPQLLMRHMSSARPDKEGDAVGLGRSPDKSFRNPKNAHVHKTSANPATIRQTVCTAHQCIGIWRGRHTLTRGRHQPTKTCETTPPPYHLLLSNVHTN